MPGVVQQWVKEVRQEKEMWAHEDLLDRFEQRYAPTEYETTGSSENQLEARDRLYEGDWNVAQREAARELTKLVAENPGKSYVELLDQYDRKQMEQTQRPKPANELSNEEIVTEAREIHGRFAQLSEQYNEAQPTQRPQLREEMEPLVDRERALRQEYTGRATQEMNIDRPPVQQIEYSR